MWVLVGVVAGVQPYFVAALVDAAQQLSYGWVLWFVVCLFAGVGAAADEIEGAGQAVLFELDHDPVEAVGRFDWVESVPAVDSDPRG